MIFPMRLRDVPMVLASAMYDRVTDDFGWPLLLAGMAVRQGAARVKNKVKRIRAAVTNAD